jgi:ABC-type oligopeptide transport system substrate-binding subunit
LDVALSPTRKDIPIDGKITTGPYFLSSKEPGRLKLSSNPYFFISASRPSLEILIVESDDTALRLFEKGQLNFLRRLTAENIPQFSKHPGLRQLPLARFDYIGVAGILDSSPKNREALIASIQSAFPAFQKMFSSLGAPGCFSLPANLSEGAVCFPKTMSSKDLSQPLTEVLPLYYSTQGGHDIERGMTLFQSVWKKAGWNIELRPYEATQLHVLLQNSKTRPALFRRGVPLDRPTCLAAAELFTSDHPDNLIGLKDTNYDSLVKKLLEQPNTANCRKALTHLLSTHRIIPMGEIYFHQVSDQKFDNIFINSLNQLDLARLSPHKSGK